MNIPFQRMVRLTILVVVSGAVSCASAAHPPQKAPSAPAHDTGALEQRIQNASRIREAVATAIAHEDAPRHGKAKTLLVREQVSAAAALAASSLPTAPYGETDVRAYEAACAELETAYLQSLLESTDAPAQPGPWTRNEGRDVLGSVSVDAKLAAWQAKEPARPFVKFAVVKAADGHGLEVRVGALDVGHVDIAGGLALSAGLLRTAVIGGKTVVVELENTSGGYRPGPLRNRTALAAFDAAGYLPASASDLTKHDNPTGGYDSSMLMGSMKR